MISTVTEEVIFNMESLEAIHRPVMVKEVIDQLLLRPGMKVLDCTVGSGGHAREILKQIEPNGEVIGIDRDAEILSMAQRQLSGFPIKLIHGNFRNVSPLVQEVGYERFDAAFFDLGVSSYQLETADRGFSFQREGKLDMRMDQKEPVSAFDLINLLPESELAKILTRFGQERYARRISRRIVQERRRGPIVTTTQLADLISRNIPHRHWGRIHPATRIFQALRIAVNRELEALENAIPQVVELLNPAGRLAIISFHSLEDRIVKTSFRRFALQGQLRILTKKPLEPLEREIQENPRSRSAKLRAAEVL